MKYCFIFIAFVSLLCSCEHKQVIVDTDVLVKVKDRTLHRYDVQTLIPRNMSSADSLMMAHRIEQKWIHDQLAYDVALRNLDAVSKAEVDKLVEEYRYSLIRYRYQEQLIRERLSAEFSELDKQRYYEEHQDQFVLDGALVKGLFLKVPKDAPNLVEVKAWCRSTTEESVEKIEKYSVQNATIYDYFYDKWVEFDQVIDNIPMRVVHADDYLRANRFMEVTDSTYCYLLNIKEFIPSGEMAPYDYVQSRIVDMLTNLRKEEFLHAFEQDLFNDAMKSGLIKYMDETP